MVVRSSFIGLALICIVAGCGGPSGDGPGGEGAPVATSTRAPTEPADATDASSDSASAHEDQDAGESRDAKAASDAQVSANDAAASCTPVFPPGTSCSNCVNAFCASELASCNGDCDCLAFNACDGDCMVNTPANDFSALTACTNACKAKHPVGEAKFLTLAKCSYANCSATDGGTGACS